MELQEPVITDKVMAATFDDVKAKLRGEKSAIYQTYTLEVKRWNEVMQNAPVEGESDNSIIAKIIRQSSFVKEEANELHDAAKLHDVVEMLDGHLDTRFVNDQIGVYLEALGVDLKGAWEEVCRSNNSKFSSDYQMMEQSVSKFAKEGIDVEIVESPVPYIYVLKRKSDGKIMKPICFKEPNLKPFIPQHLL